MEKIKQAIELAKQKKMQEAKKVSVSNIDDHLNEKANNDEIGKIEYSSTLIQQLNKDILKKNRVIVDEESDEVDTAYRMLRTQVLQKLVANEWNSLAITSPGNNQGKTLTAINLAFSLAREVNYTVLLVDFDLKRPGIHQYLGITPRAGISDFLLHDTPLDKMLMNPGINRLVILPGREALSNSSEMLKSKKMLKLVDELKSRYPSRLVIFDLPPLLETDDALAFSPFVESLLLVLEEGKANEEDIKQSLNLLKGTHLIGTVLNKSREVQKVSY